VSVVGRTTSFSLNADLERFVRSKVDSGDYDSASEVMREALTRMADEDRKEQELLAALDAGLASRRAKAGVWARVDAKVRRARSKRA
jgi:antitoxin ParD1/3/4